MKTIRTRICRAIFAFGVVGAFGFGATQALAAPSPDENPGTDNCQTCAQQCPVIKLCQPGYCECANET